MRILLFGKRGQLGYELNRCLLTLGDVFAFDKEDFDFLESQRLPHVIHEVKPDIVINAAAYTAVDQAEVDESEARLINEISPGVIAEEAKKSHILFLHFSTDYVFDGKKGLPYTEEDNPNPVNVYGKTKLAGGRVVQGIGGPHLIFRTSWLYSLRTPSFPTKVLALARNQEVLKIVDDQVGSPTWARYLAELTYGILNRDVTLDSGWLNEISGTYHVAGGGSVSRYDWALKVLSSDPKRSEQVVKKVLPVKSSTFQTPAERPQVTALNCQKFERVFNIKIHSWEETLKLAMEI
jgi:dTDP-4-dehydrorhamnose reductase